MIEEMPGSLSSRVVLILICMWPALAQERRIAISGTVLDPTGTPVPATQVTLQPSSGPRQIAATDEVGAFRFEAVVPGNYTIEVAREGFIAASVPLRVGGRPPAPLR